MPVTFGTTLPRPFRRPIREPRKPMGNGKSAQGHPGVVVRGHARRRTLADLFGMVAFIVWVSVSSWHRRHTAPMGRRPGVPSTPRHRVRGTRRMMDGTGGNVQTAAETSQRCGVGGGTGGSVTAGAGAPTTGRGPTPYFMARRLQPSFHRLLPVLALALMAGTTGLAQAPVVAQPPDVPRPLAFSPPDVPQSQVTQPPVAQPRVTQPSDASQPPGVSQLRLPALSSTAAPACRWPGLRSRAARRRSPRTTRGASGVTLGADDDRLQVSADGYLDNIVPVDSVRARRGGARGAPVQQHVRRDGRGGLGRGGAGAARPPPRSRPRRCSRSPAASTTSSAPSTRCRASRRRATSAAGSPCAAGRRTRT